VIFSVPGIVIASAFVSIPYVARAVLPVLQEIGTEQEQAAATLGARPFATLWRITLPSIRWALAYGVTLTTARVLGEFGAVSIVSGNITNKTETLTLFVGGPVRQLQPRRGVRRCADSRPHVTRRARAAQPGTAEGEHSPMTIEIRNISKRFGPAVALDSVDLDVPEGSLTAF
jgi:hypothetical protein